MTLGSIYGGLTLSGIEAEVEEIDFGDLGDYGGREERKKRRKRRKKSKIRRKKKKKGFTAEEDGEEESGGRPTPDWRLTTERGRTRRKKRKERRKSRRTGRKAKRTSRRTLRKETMWTGAEGRKARRAARKAGRKTFKAHKKGLRKSWVKGVAVPKIGEGKRKKQLQRQQRRLSGIRRICKPGRFKTIDGVKHQCLAGKWSPIRRKKARIRLPSTSEQAMALAAEAQAYPQDQWSPEAGYRAEEAYYPPTETLDYPSAAPAPSYWEGGGGGGGGAMEPYAPAEAAVDEAYEEDEGYDDAEEEGGGTGLIIGAVVVALLGGVGFYIYKKRQAGEPPFGGEAELGGPGGPPPLPGGPPPLPPLP